MPGAAGRYVPRPPQGFANSGMSNRPNGESLGHGAASFNGNANKPSAERPSTSPRIEPSQMAFNHNVPRPPAGFNPGRASFNNDRGAQSTSRPSFNSPRSSGSFNSVPRPTGRVMPAPHSNYSASAEGYGNRSYGGSSYGSSNRAYNGSSYGRSYGGSSYGRSYSGSPYGGSSRSYGNYGSSRSYSAPHYSAPSGGSYGGGHSYSAPSHSSGGGGGFHGGGGGGGSHSSGGHR